MSTRLSLLALVTTLFACADAQSPDDLSTAADAIEIADGRTGNRGEDLSTWASRPVFTEIAAAARAYWQANDPAYEEDIRIMGVAEGAFTLPGSSQVAVLYVMSVWPRCCPKSGLAVIEGDQLVYNAVFTGIAQALSAIPDIDDDGLDELVLTGFFGMGGQESGSVTLAHFLADGFTDRGSTAMYDGACAAGHAGSTAARITAGPGPSFTVERFIQPSCEVEEWTPVGDPEPLTFEPPAESRYISLPVN